MILPVAANAQPPPVETLSDSPGYFALIFRHQNLQASSFNLLRNYPSPASHYPLLAVQAADNAGNRIQQRCILYIVFPPSRASSPFIGLNFTTS
jgi:hypothetical protein